MRWAIGWVSGRMRGWTWIGIGGLAGCAPALDWREVRPEASDVVAVFPCKPDRAEREVPLGERRVRMRLLSCSVDGTVFALSGSDAVDPAQVTPALAALRETAARNVAAPAAAAVAFVVPGATPNGQAGRLRLDGRRPDGQPLIAHAAFFARGTAVWQATVMGAAPPAEAVDTFFAGLQAGR
jgi:hypothetical protein